jgi:hypothetical protein
MGRAKNLVRTSFNGHPRYSSEETDKFLGYEELLRCMFISHSSTEATWFEVEVS